MVPERTSQLSAVEKELERQGELLRTAFQYLLSPSYRNEKGITEPEAMRRYQVVSDLRRTDFSSRLDALCDPQSGEFLPQYAFLGEMHLGLNVTLVGVLSALQDPLTFGRKVEHAVEGRAVSDRSGKR